jgi:hypothetical protein
VTSLRGKDGRARSAAVRALLARGGENDWERALTEAFAFPRGARAALINEQLSELDYRAQRWARVPRVCASVATSTSFLLASLALREGLATAAILGEDARGSALDHVVISGLNVATIGLAGAAFCIAIQMRARAAVRSQLESADALVERLEFLEDTHKGAHDK